MRAKTIINAKGEQQATRIEIPLEGGGGALGMNAVKGLTAMISRLKEEKTPEDIVDLWHMICGYAICCQTCGFLTEKSVDDLMHTVEVLAEIEIERAKQQTGEGKA